MNSSHHRLADQPLFLKNKTKLNHVTVSYINIILLYTEERSKTICIPSGVIHVIVFVAKIIGLHCVTVVFPDQAHLLF